MDGISRFPQAGNEAFRAFFHLDVPDLRDGRLFSGPMPAYEKQMCPGAGDGLCDCHFCCGISDRKFFEKTQNLSMGLFRQPV